MGLDTIYRFTDVDNDCQREGTISPLTMREYSDVLLVEATMRPTLSLFLAVSVAVFVQSSHAHARQSDDEEDAEDASEKPAPAPAPPVRHGRRRRSKPAPPPPPPMTPGLAFEGMIGYGRPFNAGDFNPYGLTLAARLGWLFDGGFYLGARVDSDFGFHSDDGLSGSYNDATIEIGGAVLLGGAVFRPLFGLGAAVLESASTSIGTSNTDYRAVMTVGASLFYPATGDFYGGVDLRAHVLPTIDFSSTWAGTGLLMLGRRY